MRKKVLLSIIAIGLFSSHSFTPAKSGDFAWGCFGPEGLGNGLRIINAREPGSNIVVIRNQANGIALRLTAAGPETQITVPDFGRYGEDGIMVKRVYTDSIGRRWIYSNLDAHPTFKLYENREMTISCSP